MKRKHFNYTFLGIIVISTIIGFITRLDIGILVFDGLSFAAFMTFYLCYKEEKEEGQGEENEEEKKL